MKLFLLVILLSSQVYAKSAEQCMTEAIRMTIAFKIKGPVVKIALGMDSGNTKNWDELTPTDLCSNTDRIQSSIAEIEETKNDKLKMIKFTLRELKEKGKVSGAQFGSDKEYLKENEICTAIDESSEFNGYLEGNCPKAEASVTTKLKSHRYEASSFEKNCEALAKVYIQSRRDCEKEERQTSVVNREPPGEEIAPAEDEPVKVKLNKPVVDSVRPAKVDLNPKPRSGAVAQ